MEIHWYPFKIAAEFTQIIGLILAKEDSGTESGTEAKVLGCDEKECFLL